MDGRPSAAAWRGIGRDGCPRSDPFDVGAVPSRCCCCCCCSPPRPRRPRRPPRSNLGSSGPPPRECLPARMDPWLDDRMRAPSRVDHPRDPVHATLNGLAFVRRPPRNRLHGNGGSQRNERICVFPPVPRFPCSLFAVLSAQRRPALERGEGPALERSEGPALERSEGPALERSEGPARHHRWQVQVLRFAQDDNEVCSPPRPLGPPRSNLGSCVFGRVSVEFSRLSSRRARSKSV
jgi:hypothetical protein